jgi:hypothetical protein
MLLLSTSGYDMSSIKLEIRSNQPGKLVPVNLRVSAGEAHFRVRTEFLVKSEFWNPAKKELKPLNFDQMDFTRYSGASEQSIPGSKTIILFV